MKFKILTIFPDMIRAVLGESILGRAIASGAIEAEVIDIRPYSQNKHKNTDDTPYGGGAGMVMLAQPIVDAVETAMGDDFHGRRIYLSPRGKTLTQPTVERLAQEEELILLCGHYEGVDQRAIDLVIDEEISVGDYVLTGGELAAAVMADAIVRIVPGVIGDEQSALSDCFQDDMLSAPIYTRPADYKGWKVPDILLSGNEAKIKNWEMEQAMERTQRLRPDLLDK